MLAIDLLNDFIIFDQKNENIRKSAATLVKDLFSDPATAADADAWKELVGAYLRKQCKIWMRDDDLSQICALERKDEVLAVLTNLRNLKANRINGVDGGWKEVTKPIGHIQVSHQGSKDRTLGRIYWRNLADGRAIAVFHQKKDDREQQTFMRRRLGGLNSSLQQSGVNAFLDQISGPLDGDEENNA